MTRTLFPEIVVNGTTLSAASIAAEAQNHPAPEGKPGLAWRRAARALVIRQLLLEEAERLHIEASPKELEPGKVETPEEACIRELLSRVVKSEPVSEAALRAAYDNHPERVRAPALYQPAHILIAAPQNDEAQRASARVRADKILEDLLRDPRGFTEAARLNSACSSRDVGGQLGQLSGGDTVPEFEAAMDAAPVGEVFDRVVETRYGFHILRMDARAPGDVLPFETVRPRLEAACEKANWARSARAYVTELVDRAEIIGLDLERVA